MDLFMESTDFDSVRLSIYEKYNNNEITESQKDELLEYIQEKEMDEAYMEMVSMNAIASMAAFSGAAAAAVVAAGAMIALVTKVIPRVKANKKIDDSKELTKIRNDIKKCMTSLKASKNELNKIINRYSNAIGAHKTRAKYYGKKHQFSPSLYLGSEFILGARVHKNYDYDKNKSLDELDNAKKLKEIRKKYIDKKNEIKEQIKTLKKLESGFISIINNNMSQEETEKIRAALDKVMEDINVQPDDD